MTLDWTTVGARAAAISLLACSLGLGQAHAQNLVIGKILAMEGDALSSGSVISLYAVTTDADGKVAAIGSGSAGSIDFYYVESDGYNEMNGVSITTVTQAQIGFHYPNVAWIPLHSGYDKLYINDTEVLNPTEDIPGTTVEIDNIRRPHYTNQGNLYVWVDGLAATREYLLQRTSGGVWDQMLSENEVITISSFDYTVNNIEPKYDVSPLTEELIAIVQVGNSGTNDDPGLGIANNERVLSDKSAWVVIEGDSVSSTSGSSHWADFDQVAINSSGNAVVAGENAEGEAVLGYFTAGTPSFVPVSDLVQSDSLDGFSLGPKVRSVSINEAGHVAFLWDEETSGTGGFFLDCDPSDLSDAQKVLRDGDFIDVDVADTGPDGIADYEVVDIPLSGIDTREFDLQGDDADKGVINLRLLLESDLAVVRIPYDCDCTGDLTAQDWDDDGECGDIDLCPYDANHEDVNPANGIPDCAEVVVVEEILVDGFEDAP